MSDFCCKCKHFSSLNFAEVWKFRGLCLKTDHIVNFRERCDSFVEKGV